MLAAGERQLWRHEGTIQPHQTLNAAQASGHFLESPSSAHDELTLLRARHDGYVNPCAVRRG